MKGSGHSWGKPWGWGEEAADAHRHSHKAIPRTIWTPPNSPPPPPSPARPRSNRFVSVLLLLGPFILSSFHSGMGRLKDRDSPSLCVYNFRSCLRERRRRDLNGRRLPRGNWRSSPLHADDDGFSTLAGKPSSSS
uniref:Uncharacterized protein n=1 Tax=Globodera rostochiensis TaxID=31243 RepID=A0A914HI07_GLORO